MNPNFNVQMFPTPGAGAVIRPENSAQVGGVIGSGYLPPQESGGEMGRRETARESDPQPKIISSSGGADQNSNPGVTTGGGGGGGGTASVNGATKSPVSTGSTGNKSSSVSGRKNYTVEAQYPDRRGVSSVGAGGSGTGGNGGEGGAVGSGSGSSVGSGEVVKVQDLCNPHGLATKALETTTPQGETISYYVVLKLLIFFHQQMHMHV